MFGQTKRGSPEKKARFFLCRILPILGKESKNAPKKARKTEQNEKKKKKTGKAKKKTRKKEKHSHVIVKRVTYMDKSLKRQSVKHSPVNEKIGYTNPVLVISRARTHSCAV